MSEPYTPAMIATILRAMPAERLARVAPRDFQTWPTRRVVPSAIVRELIDNELAWRR